MKILVCDRYIVSNYLKISKIFTKTLWTAMCNFCKTPLIKPQSRYCLSIWNLCCGTACSCLIRYPGQGKLSCADESAQIRILQFPKSGQPVFNFVFCEESFQLGEPSWPDRFEMSLQVGLSGIARCREIQVAHLTWEELDETLCTARPVIRYF